MSTSLHAKTSGELKIDFKLDFTTDGEPYPILNFNLDLSTGFEDIAIFPSFKHLLEMQKKLNQLINEAKERGFIETKGEETEHEENYSRTMQRSIPDSAF
jgi:hypothetical protein